jgi:ribosomal-protein-alanine N-acetyltransferase
MELDCGLCVVRSWRPADAASLARHANDRDIWLALRDRFPHPYTEDDAEKWIAFATAQDPETSLAIDVKGDAVGGIGFQLRTDVERCGAEVGYYLGKQYWGRGIVTAALQQATVFALQRFALTRVYALPFADNAASIRVLEKAGYRCEGRLRRSAVKDGVVKDQLLYAVTDEDVEAAGMAK